MILNVEIKQKTKEIEKVFNNAQFNELIKIV